MTTVVDIPRTYFEPRRLKPSVGRRRRVALVAAVAVLLGAAGWGGNTLLHSCGGLRSGVTSVGGECVGVTDGGYVFGPWLKDIEAKIKAENDWVRAQPGGYVNVVLLSSFTTDETSPLTEGLILHSAQGAYTAQRRANRTYDLGDKQPLIRLLLANEGTREQHWERVVGQIEAMAGDDHPVVAVIGLGVSVRNTELGARHLSRHDIPMVGAVLSADGLDHEHIPGLIRVTPNNTDYVNALYRHLRGRSDLKTGVLVYDSSEPDLYTKTLRQAMERGLEPYLTGEPLSFVGVAVPSRVEPQMFDSVTRGVCAESPDVVFYAGRSVDLYAFIQSLTGPACRKKRRLTIMVGATGMSTIRQHEQKVRDGNLTVVYASSADPAWQHDPTGRPEHYDEFLTAFTTEVEPAGGALDDGYALMHHDALATAVTAIRLAAPVTNRGRPLTPADVGSQLLNLSGEYAIPGGSGTLTFSRRRGGNPGNKPVPVVRIPPPTDGRAEADPYVTR